jgi:hypothetical protein
MVDILQEPKTMHPECRLCPGEKRVSLRQLMPSFCISNISKPNDWHTLAEIGY